MSEKVKLSTYWRIYLASVLFDWAISIAPDEMIEIMFKGIDIEKNCKALRERYFK